MLRWSNGRSQRILMLLLFFYTKFLIICASFLPSSIKGHCFFHFLSSLIRKFDNFLDIKLIGLHESLLCDWRVSSVHLLLWVVISYFLDAFVLIHFCGLHIVLVELNIFQVFSCILFIFRILEFQLLNFFDSSLLRLNFQLFLEYMLSLIIIYSFRGCDFPCKFHRIIFFFRTTKD